MDSYCRSCFRSDDFQAVSLEEVSESNEVSVSVMLAYCTKLEISVGDSLPQQICYECLTSLDSLFAFRRLCRQNDASFRSMASRKKVPEQQLFHCCVSTCAASAVSMEELEEHARQQHSQLRLTKARQRRSDHAFVCSICMTGFGYKQGWKYHNSRVLEPSKRRTIACEKCQQKFYTMAKLAEHIVEMCSESAGIEAPMESEQVDSRIVGNESSETEVKLEDVDGSDSSNFRTNCEKEVNETIKTELDHFVSELERKRFECTKDIASTTIEEQLESRLQRKLDTTPATVQFTVKLTNEEKFVVLKDKFALLLYFRQKQQLSQGRKINFYYSCQTCQFVSKKLRLAEQHLDVKACKGVEPVLRFSASKTELVLKCGMCAYRSARRANLQRHQRSANHSGVRESVGKLGRCHVLMPKKYSHLTTQINCRTELKCTQCSYLTVIRRELENHQQTEGHVGVDMLHISSTKILICVICGYQTDKKMDMYRHHSLKSHIMTENSGTDTQEQSKPTGTPKFEESSTLEVDTAIEPELQIEQFEDSEDSTDIASTTIEERLERRLQRALDKIPVNGSFRMKLTEEEKFAVLNDDAALLLYFNQSLGRGINFFYSCQSCQFMARTHNAAEQHLLFKPCESILPVLTINDKRMQCVFECKVCPYKTAYNANIHRHQRSTNHSGIRKTTDQPVRFRSIMPIQYKKLTMRIKRKTPQTEGHVGVVGSRILKCKICAYQTEQELDMFRHHSLKKHTIQKKPRKTVVQTELKTPEQPPPRTPNPQHTSSSNQSTLKRPTHPPKKPAPDCQYCGRRYSTRANLLRHQRSAACEAIAGRPDSSANHQNQCQRCRKWIGPAAIELHQQVCDGKPLAAADLESVIKVEPGEVGGATKTEPT